MRHENELVSKSGQVELSPALIDAFGFDIRETKFPDDLEAPNAAGEAMGRKSPVSAAWSGNIIRVNF